MLCGIALSASPIQTPSLSFLCKRPPHRRGLTAIRAMSASANRGVAATVGVDMVEGLGGLPKVKLTSSGGGQAEIYLFGACITSWKPLNRDDLLFVRPDAVFNGQKPISGGIPHCFPQFGPGTMQQHGFARNVNWSLVDSENNNGDSAVTFELKETPYSQSMWDFCFQALYKVTLSSSNLTTVLTIRNTDNKPFSFSSALHTYFRANVDGASVKGLKNCKTLNKVPDPSNPVEGKEEREAVNFPGFVDCIYLDAPAELQLDNGLGDIIKIRNTNWSDAVLWNPHLQMESCYKDFVCVENAKIGNVHLDPEQAWVAEQCIAVE